MENKINSIEKNETPVEKEVSKKTISEQKSRKNYSKHIHLLFLR
jgi:hypothetical protein